jgi:hypothetical protein
MLLRLMGWALRLFLVNFTNRILIQADVLASGHMPSDFDSPQTLFENLPQRELVEALQAKTSRRFFLGLVELLVTALGCTCAYVAELRQEGRTFRTCSVSAGGNTIDDFESPDRRYTLRNGAERRGRSLSGWPPTTLPEDQVIRHWDVVSYAGVPLVNAQGICVGYLAVFCDRSMIKDSPGG